MTRLLYFAWVKDKTGIASEDIELPSGISTVADLIGWLKTRGPEFTHAFEQDGAIRAAVDQTHARLDTSIADAKEIAFFPPVTGG
ncbi:MAG: molybdopterin converting factor subunit 1 [Methyloceanibacter sp.]|uniref:molybdopterin converting factor subunit 1 n=1 Tax=Methyloceanibacter sp. TaxID=1965321 RepID=UPI001DDB7165|nr:molybdopterin converting factor subunit 1 [Methyloceanibacter sp.]MCB1441606.1 molybdopterin converting factor subunit 1 [Methyloceanibacter sp.]